MGADQVTIPAPPDGFTTTTIAPPTGFQSVDERVNFTFPKDPTETDADQSNAGGKGGQILDFARYKNPALHDMPDGQLATLIRTQHYPHLDTTDFYRAIKRPDLVGDTGKESVLSRMSGGEVFRAGVGRSIMKNAHGLGQFLGIIPQSQIDEEQRIDAPLAHSDAGIMGDMAGQMGQMLIPGGIAGKIGQVGKFGVLGRMGLQAAAGASYAGAQAVPTGGSRLENAAAGGAAGALGEGAGSLIGAGVKRFAGGFADLLDPVKLRLAQDAAKLGIPVRAAQLSSNPLVQGMSSMANKLPFSGGAAANAAQKAAVNRAVSQTFGENTPAITSDIYSSAIKRIGGVFNDLTQRNTLAVDAPLLQKLFNVQQEAAQYGTTDAAKAVDSAIAEFTGKLQKAGSDGFTMPGKAYQPLDSKLGRVANPGEPGGYLRQLRNVIRDGMDASISPADQAAWQEARSQYANLKTVRDLIAKSDGGGISPQGLMGRVTSNGYGKEAMARGTRGDLGTIAKVSSGLLKDQIPDSGTTTRLIAASLLGGGGSLAGGPVAAIPALLGGATLGRAINSNGLAQYMLKGAGPKTVFAANQLAKLARGLPLATPGIAVNTLQKNLAQKPAR